MGWTRTKERRRSRAAGRPPLLHRNVGICRLLKTKKNKKACPRVHAVGRPPLLPAEAANQKSTPCVHSTGLCNRASTAAASRAVPVVASCPQSQSVIRAMHAARHIGISEASAAKPRKTHDGFTEQTHAPRCHHKCTHVSASRKGQRICCGVYN